MNLIQIRMPVAAIVSIGHRISGFLLIIAIPFLIHAFQLSLTSAEDYDRVLTVIEHPIVLAIFAIITWSFAHHFFAGIRFLLIDIDIGVSKTAARASAWLIHVLALSTTILTVGAFL